MEHLAQCLVFTAGRTVRSHQQIKYHVNQKELSKVIWPHSSSIYSPVDVFQPSLSTSKREISPWRNAFLGVLKLTSALGVFFLLSRLAIGRTTYDYG